MSFGKRLTTLGMVLLLGLFGVVTRTNADEEKKEAPEVQLEPSFQLKQKKGREVSHMPGVVFTPDGERLITGTSNGEVIIWRASDRTILKRKSFSDAPIEAMAMDPRGTRLLVLFEDGKIRAIDPETGVAETELTVGEAARKAEKRNSSPAANNVQQQQYGNMGLKKSHGRPMAIAPGGDRWALAIGTTIQVRNGKRLRIEARRPDAHDKEITNLAFSPNGNLLASVGLDGRLRVWDLEKLSCIAEAKAKQALYAVDFAPDGTHVAYGGHEKKVWELDLETEASRVVTTESQPFWITVCEYSPDGRTLAIGDESCDVWLYDLSSGKRFFHSKHHVECWLSSVAWTPDSETFLFGCRPNTHAGKPQFYMQNGYAEAALDPKARKLEKKRRQLEEKVVDLYGRRTEATVQKKLRKLLQAKAALLGQEGLKPGALERGYLLDGLQKRPGIQTKALTFGWQNNTPQQEAQLYLPDQQEQRRVPALNAREKKELTVLNGKLKRLRDQLEQDVLLQAARKRLEALARAHRLRVERRVEELKRDFCVNQWRIQKK